MTAKRKRSASRRSRASSGKAVSEKEQPKRKNGSAARPLDSPFPTLWASLAAGFRAAGSSPSILATAFVSLAATWGVFVAMGSEVGPRTLSLLLSAPPVHVFIDAPVALAAGSTGLFSVLAVAGLAALRGSMFALLILLILGCLRDGRPSMRTALRELPRAAVVVGGLYLIQFGLVVAAFQLLVGFLGQLAVLTIAAALYFLAFAPIVAAAEGDGPRQALRRGVRAARLPGTRHLSMVMAYFLLPFYAGAITPFGLLTPATPSFALWAYALVITFVHISVLAAFAYRWLAVRDQVPEVVPPQR